MTQITYTDLQCQRELYYYRKLRPILETLKKKWQDFERRNQLREKEIFRHLSHSVHINRLRGIRGIMSEINERLNTRFRVELFLFQSPLPNALCMAGAVGTAEGDELLILVSQHFLNELTREEQICVLGHELAHLVFGHVRIPGKVVLESSAPLAITGELKSDILKWMICSEISCDIFSYVAANKNIATFSLALLKYTTGLSHRTATLVNEDDDLTSALHAQYDEIVSATFDPKLTTHPLTPLRLRVTTSISDCDLVRKYGETVAENDKRRYCEHFNRIIDGVLGKIYPEIIGNDGFRGNRVLLDLCLAVALSDGQVKQQEIAAIVRIIQTREESARLYREISERLRAKGYQTLVREFVQGAIQETRRSRYDGGELRRILRHLLVVAASDGLVQKCELETIFTYAREFGFTKPMIGTLLESMGLR